MTVRSYIDLRGTGDGPAEGGLIQANLPDNNAGEITAKKVRDTMVDIVDSIVPIVSNGDFQVYPFTKNVELRNSTDGCGILICSGIKFVGSDVIQTSAVSIDSIPHSGLKFLLEDDHPQYLRTEGVRLPSGDIPMGNKWLNSSGALYFSNRGFHGLQFVQTSSNTTQINVGSGTQFNFFKDSSKINSSRGVAKAWIRFDSSNGNLTVQDCYNVSGISRLDTGKFLITFTSGVFKDNNYVAFASSNGRGTATNLEDFSEISVGCYLRTGNDDDNGLRSVSFGAYDKFNNNFVDAKINELVAFGTEPGGSGYLCTVTNTTP